MLDKYVLLNFLVIINKQTHRKISMYMYVIFFSVHLILHLLNKQLNLDTKLMKLSLFTESHFSEVKNDNA